MAKDYQIDNRSFKRNRGRAWRVRDRFYFKYVII